MTKTEKLRKVFDNALDKVDNVLAKRGLDPDYLYYIRETIVHSTFNDILRKLKDYKYTPEEKKNLRRVDCKCTFYPMSCMHGKDNGQKQRDTFTYNIGIVYKVGTLEIITIHADKLKDKGAN